MVMVIVRLLLARSSVFGEREACMTLSTRPTVSFVALVAFSAEAADVTGDWSATIVTSAGQRDYTFVFRQNEGRLIGTIRSPDGVAAISNGYINNKTITFTENATVQGRRAVLDYTGELVSDPEIRFKREVAGTTSPAVEFVATRIGRP
jgi:hypothetical protein